jgi:hypothetical protein
MSEPTPEEILGNWEELFTEFKRATPSSPNWFGIIDMAVGVLVSERVDALKKQIAARSPPHEKETPHG